MNRLRAPPPNIVLSSGIANDANRRDVRDVRSTAVTRVVERGTAAASARTTRASSISTMNRCGAIGGSPSQRFQQPLEPCLPSELDFEGIGGAFDLITSRWRGLRAQEFGDGRPVAASMTNGEEVFAVIPPAHSGGGPFQTQVSPPAASSALNVLSPVTFEKYGWRSCSMGF
jgi:hypothetical protein